MSAHSPAQPATPNAENTEDSGDRDDVVFVTGAGGGIGGAVVGALLATDAQVYATDVDGDALDELARQHSSERLHTRIVDVRDTASVETAVTQAEAEVGPIAGLVCAHGILRAGSALSQLDEEWQLVHDVNVGGVMRVARAVTRGMAARQRGAVVTIGSNAAAVARDGLSAYASSKAAARHYTLCLGVELAPLGIRCNVVSPGSTDTAMLSGAWETRDRPTEAGLEGAVNRRAIAGTPEAFWPGIPLGRIAQPEWIADAVTFLLSPQARHLALHDLRVDGGATLGA
ncbi:MAG: SDR family oxidoreductase [Solirubrobacteraceae bacterium]|nr:SDR family oxidoreductase [Solirubrobacteraceae bacterium]